MSQKLCVKRNEALDVERKVAQTYAPVLKASRSTSQQDSRMGLIWKKQDTQILHIWNSDNESRSKPGGAAALKTRRYSMIGKCPAADAKCKGRFPS